MSALDWIVAAGFLLSIVLGAWRGLVYEVLSVLNWLLAFMLAQWLGPLLGRQLPLPQSLSSAQPVLGFVLVFVAAWLLGGVLVWLLGKLSARIGLRPLDRVLGGLFGAVRACIVLLAVSLLLSLTGLQQQPWWREAVSAQLAQRALSALKPLLPQQLSQHVS